VQTLVACVDAFGPHEDSHTVRLRLQDIANRLMPELVHSYGGTMSSEDRACLQLLRCLDALIARGQKSRSFLDVTCYLWGPLLGGILKDPLGTEGVTVAELLKKPGLIEPRCAKMTILCTVLALLLK
jgi:hypothetical protein